MVHTCPVEVRFSDLDPYDHVNHAKYVEYCEMGRVAALSSVGISLDELKREGIQLVIAGIELTFHAPARLDDRLVVRSWMTDMGHASAIWHQEILCGERRIVTAVVRSAVCNAQGRPVRAPERLRLALDHLRAG